MTMSGLIILFFVFTLSWLPIENVHAEKLNTADIETANSILQRLHKMQEQKVLNDRIKKQRLEEVNNHNERVKFLHKLSRGADELYLTQEQKDVNDMLNKLKVVDSEKVNKKNDINLIDLQKTLALLQDSDNDAKGLSLSLKNKDKRNKPELPPFIQTTEMTLPTFDWTSDPLSLSQLKNKNKPLPLSFWESKSNVKSVPVLLSLLGRASSKQQRAQLLSSEEYIPVLALNENDNKSIKRFNDNDKEQENVLEKVFKLLQQQQKSKKGRSSSISLKSKNKGRSDGFMGDINLQGLLKTLQKESVPQNNYFEGSSYEETEEDTNVIEIPNDKMDGYSKVFVVLDPEALNSENNREQANKVISHLNTWAAKQNKYWEPKTNFRRRRSLEYSNEKRVITDRKPNREYQYRSNKKNRVQRGSNMSLRLSRTAAPFVHQRGDINEKIPD